MPQQNIFIVGCGHVGRAVVDLAHWLGYRTIGIDDRQDMLDALSNVDLCATGFTDIADQVSKDDAVVVVTRNAGIDLAVLPSVLATDVHYIGLMGSDSRWRTTRSKLLESGISQDDLDRINTPIGTDINAETVEEIAVSIMAEIIATSRSRK